MTQELNDEFPWRDEETLRYLYHRKGNSMREVAGILDCDYRTVYTWMDRFGIERRQSGRMAPAPFLTDVHGYESWKTMSDGTRHKVRVHRLLAVAEFGLEKVASMDVHHRNNLSWDNRPENLGLMRHDEHMAHHMRDRVENLEFDEDGDISGWSR